MVKQSATDDMPPDLLSALFWRLLMSCQEIQQSATDDMPYNVQLERLHATISNWWYATRLASTSSILQLMICHKTCFNNFSNWWFATRLAPKNIRPLQQRLMICHQTCFPQTILQPVWMIFKKPTTDDMPPGLLLQKYLQEKQFYFIVLCSQPL